MSEIVLSKMFNSLSYCFWLKLSFSSEIYCPKFLVFNSGQVIRNIVWQRSGTCDIIPRDFCRMKAIDLGKQFSMISAQNFPSGCFQRESDGRIFFNFYLNDNPCEFQRTCICYEGKFR